MSKWTPLAFVLPLLAICPPAAHAHNGAVAVALPVAGITVDGDLSDWPDGLPRFARWRMSHDLRSPMNAIIGYTRRLLCRTASRLDEREQRNLRNIATSAGNLLDLSRIEAGRVEVQPQAVDLKQLVAECADALEPNVKAGVELRRELAEVAAVTTDPDRLRQVVMNLLGNAAKFMEVGRTTLSLAARDGAVEIGVADSGIGIPAADLPHIFDEFRQVQRQGGEAVEGTGLGLASRSGRWSCWAGRSRWRARWGRGRDSA